MLNIVLYEPEIPQNTGNIMRTCIATNAKLHLIKPLGFSLDDKYLKRSGLDYLKDLDLEIYDNYSDFTARNIGQYYFLTRYGKKTHSSFNFSNTEENIYLIFGKESTGIPKRILKNHLDSCLRIPMTDKVRSLNLSNCVSIILYEVLRQQNYNNLLRTEPFKGENFLET
jgi:tRNA (cytidine/uridine-2'-O-)-methyltransferase